jgi:phospholipase/carboxylesterase
VSSGKKLMILLHGYGSDGRNMEDLVPYFKNEFSEWDFLCPNAPKECAMGYEWFPLRSLDPDSWREDFVIANKNLSEYVNSESKSRNLEPKDVIIGGFSQGCMMSIGVALQYGVAETVVGFSGELICEPSGKYHPDIFLTHGKKDTVVLIDRMHESLAKLSNYKLESHICEDLGHSISETGLIKSINFLKRKFVNV